MWRSSASSFERARIRLTNLYEAGPPKVRTIRVLAGGVAWPAAELMEDDEWAAETVNCPSGQPPISSAFPDQLDNPGNLRFVDLM